MISLRSIFSTIACVSASISLAQVPDFETDVRPILEAHCTKCHGPEKQKSKIRLDTLSTDLISDRPAAETWHDALNAINLGEMPPEDEPELSSEDREILTTWIRGTLKSAIAAQKSTGGEVIMRRLNRVEYQNTMTDLLGIKANYGKNLPPDTPSEDGFKNNGAALSMSPLQLEYYLAAAREGLSRAIVSGPPPGKIKITTTESTKKSNRKNSTSRLGYSGSFVGKFLEFPDEGEFIIRVKARAELVEGKAFPRLKAVFGYRADTQTPSAELGEIDITSSESSTYEFRGRMEQFPVQSRTQSKYPGQLVMLENAFDDGIKRKEKRTIEKEVEVKNKKGKIQIKKQKTTEWIEHNDVPKIVIEAVQFEGPIYEAWPPASHTRIFAQSANREKGELIYAEEVVENFMTRAYRRPVEKADVRSMLRLFTKIRPTSATFEDAVRDTLALVLVSPDFLYLVEPEQGDGISRAALTDHELASRLSYFLWSTMPDSTLFEAASNGELRDPKKLEAQIDRMLAHDKSWQFIEQFTNQWLDLASVDRVAVNPDYYENWDDAIKPSMQDETRHFFAEILKNDLSALNFIDSDFAMLNAPMARHYGIENGPRGNTFERVALPADSPRGGIMTNASVLLGNSTGEDSHPILRAVWIRERLLDDPPAPPPPNVPPLESENPNFAKLPVRQQLEIPRKDPACDDCHRGIDPWGIALENFDAIGNWRTEIRRKNGKKFVTQPAEPQTELPGGHAINGVADLQNFLKEHRSEQFARAIVARLTGYALGRNLELTDELELDALTEEFSEANHRLRPLIYGIANSELFQTK